MFNQIHQNCWNVCTQSYILHFKLKYSVIISRGLFVGPTWILHLINYRFEGPSLPPPTEPKNIFFVADNNEKLSIWVKNSNLLGLELEIFHLKLVNNGKLKVGSKLSLLELPQSHIYQDLLDTWYAIQRTTKAPEKRMIGVKERERERQRAICNRSSKLDLVSHSSVNKCLNKFHR